MGRATCSSPSYAIGFLWRLVSFVPAYFIVVIDAHPNTATVEQGTTLVLVCRVVGVPSTTVLSYQWTCPGGSCDAGAVDPEWAAKVQLGNILVVNVRNGNDTGDYTCTVIEEDSTTRQVGVDVFTLSVASEYNYYASILCYYYLLYSWSDLHVNGHCISVCIICKY